MAKKIIIGAVVILGLVVLMMWPKLSDPQRALYKKWNQAGVECLPNGHVNLSQHIHADVSITMDGTAVAVPANIGITKNCMAGLHTHDGSGEIHIESVSPVKIFTLGQFFEVWGQPLIRDGYTLQMTVNNASSTEPEQLILQDHQIISLVYIKL